MKIKQVNISARNNGQKRHVNRSKPTVNHHFILWHSTLSVMAKSQWVLFHGFCLGLYSVCHSSGCYSLFGHLIGVLGGPNALGNFWFICTGKKIKAHPDRPKHYRTVERCVAPCTAPPDFVNIVGVFASAFGHPLFLCCKSKQLISVGPAE